jgi:hypothetical protein
MTSYAQIFEEGTLEVEATGQTWKVADMGAMLDHSRTAAELYPDISTLPPLPQNRWFSSAAPRDPTKERVVEVRPLVVSVAWMAINQKVRLVLSFSLSASGLRLSFQLYYSALFEEAN